MIEGSRGAARGGIRPRAIPVNSGEFDLIARIRARATREPGLRGDVVLGIGDDAALLRVPADRLLVVATDTLNDGVHFPPDTSPADLGWKALAVNLSDIAAMGAQPAWSTLSLSMPHADVQWIDAFLDGYFELAAQHDVALVGGDTTRGPLSVCVTVHGFVEPDRALRRSGARIGDDIWVTGTLGDAAAALTQWRAGGAADPALRQRLDRPRPRIDVGRELIGIAHACIDVSDGLLADLGHLCAASGVAAQVDVDALPASPKLAEMFTAESRRTLQASGGDDYELCFTAAPTQRAMLAAVSGRMQIAMTLIGTLVAGSGVAAHDRQHQPWTASSHGFDHFGGH